LSDEQEIRESVDAAKAPGTFNIVEVLQNRNYPKTQTVIHLDEQAAYDASIVAEEIEELDKKIGRNAPTATQSKKLEGLNEKKQELVDRLKGSSYVFYLTGISEGVRESLWSDCKKKYPVQYSQTPELATGRMVKEERESPERDDMFTNLLWQNHIEKIVDPSGNEQSGLSFTQVREMRNIMPLASTAKINQAIEKMRVASAVFMFEANEDFLAKP
jgi:hypothetical protein